MDEKIAELKFSDLEFLQRKRKKIHARRHKGLPSDKLEAEYAAALEQKIADHQRYLDSLPHTEFDSELPVCERRDEIARTILDHQVTILAGETGSGKTTQLPKICLSAGFGRRGRIGHTQPRRIAARSVAARIAEELKVPLGAAVGYQVRFSEQCSEHTCIKVMTDGILLAEIQSDPLLLDYEVIILDEAHERTLNIDFLLGYLKTLLPKRPELKLVVTSATIDLEKFSAHFDNAPIIEVSGRTFPVDIEYRPWNDDADTELDAVINALDEILQGSQGQGDILVFLSGEREIRELSHELRKRDFAHLEVLPLYARLNVAEQQRVFAPHVGQRVVLSTNVAETSLTVPGIRYVIDAGKARISRYSLRTKVQRLPIEAISQASANQRAGRCGRVMHGTCYRLYSEEDFLSRPAFTDPEILRTNLASVILQMLHLNIGDIDRFPFVDAPDSRMISDGFRLLEELRAVDAGARRVTALGKKIQALPLDPSYARILLEASRLGCLNECLIIVAALSVQDPRERPQEKQQAADEKHRRFWHERSDFLAFVNLWNYLEEQRQALSQNQFKRLCQKDFLNYMRVREWRDLHMQVKLACRELKLVVNQEAASYAAVHSALLAGLVCNVGTLDDKESTREYLGTRSRKFVIYPGSSQNKKKLKWLLAADYIETSQLFAHCVAQVDVDSVAAAAEHLLKYQYFEPHYEVKTGQVISFRRATLLGLTLVEKQRAPYNKINAEEAREIFIREALVEGKYRGKGGFFKANARLIEEVQELEAKTRRRDILVDDEALYAFFDKQLPASINNLAAFEHWRKTVERDQPKRLYLSAADLMLHSADNAGEEQFPSQLQNGQYRFPVQYIFEPGKRYDGVNVRIPVDVLHEVREFELEWLVPGLLRDKCIALTKTLPKTLRKHFVPVPDFVDRLLPRLKRGNHALTEQLAQGLSVLSGTAIRSVDMDPSQLDNLYRANIVLVDENDRIVDQGRDLAVLRTQYKGALNENLRRFGDEHERENISRWDFGSLRDRIDLKRGDLVVPAYPALVNSKGSVSIKLMDDPVEARHDSIKGVCRLAALSLGQTAKTVTRDLFKGRELGLTQVSMGKKDEVVDDVLLAAIRRCCFSALSLSEPWPTLDEAYFSKALHEGRADVYAVAKGAENVLVESLQAVLDIRKRMKGSLNALMLTKAFSDISAQLGELFCPGIIFDLPADILEQYPRFLNAIVLRLEKAPQKIQKDLTGMDLVGKFWRQHQDRLQKEGVAHYLANGAWVEYRWMIEELRVSLFAQTLKTRVPVSEKRLQAKWQESLQARV